MKTKTICSFDALPKDYAALCRAAPPRPIHDPVAYRNTVEIADSFAGYENRMTADQNDYFDLLCELIQKYEAQTVKPSKLGGAALVKHPLGEHGLSGAGLSRILGKAASLGPMILRGERKITADHAVCLGKYLGLRPDVFLR
jgi:antitoxin component HigA of HigAB toxin-antitoxin module